MLENLKNQVHLRQYIAYSIAYLAYGLFFTSIGPIIPFLAQRSGVDETQFAFLFECRLYGSILTLIIIKYIQLNSTKLHTHSILAATSIFIIVFNLFFIWSVSFFFQGLWMLLLTTNYMIFQIWIEVSIIVYNENVQKTLLIVCGFYGIGSTLSPVIIGLAGVEMSFLVFSLTLGLVIPAFFFLSSPITVQDQPDNPELSEKIVSRPVEMLLCAAYCLYLGTMITKACWSSSYAVMAHVSTKEQATIYPFLYNFTNIVFKFIWLLAHHSTNSKLRLCMSSLVIVQCLSLVGAKVGFIKYSLYFENICLSIFMSPLNTLIFSVSKVYNMRLSAKQACNIEMAGVFGEIVLVMICGELMERLHIDMYYYFVIFMTALLWLAGSLAIHLMNKQYNPKIPIESQLLERSHSQGAPFK